MDPRVLIVPPLLWNCATKEVAFGYPGKALNIRTASEGHFSIYGDYSSDHSRFVIAISFEEDHLPVLGRQVVYHYLDAADDFVWETEGCLELTIPNHIMTPSSELERQAVMWRIRFRERELKTLQSIMANLRLPADMLKVNRLPKSSRELIYYNLRASVMEQPVPKGVGYVGHWQNRVAGGTPHLLPYLERAFVSQSMDEIEDVKFVEPSVQDSQQVQEALDFDKAATIDVVDRPSGRVVFYDEPQCEDCESQVATGTGPSGTKASIDDEGPTHTTADHTETSGAETERVKDAQILHTSNGKANGSTQTNVVSSSKRPRGSLSPTDKEKKAKAQKKTAHHGAPTDVATLGPLFSGQVYADPGLDMALRGGGSSSTSATSCDSSPRRSAHSGWAPDADDWCAIVNDRGDEICRYRLSDCTAPRIVPGYIKQPPNSSVRRLGGVGGGGKRRAFPVSGVGSDHGSDSEEMFFPSKTTAYVGNV